MTVIREGETAQQAKQRALLPDDPAPAAATTTTNPTTTQNVAPAPTTNTAPDMAYDDDGYIDPNKQQAQPTTMQYDDDDGYIDPNKPKPPQGGEPTFNSHAAAPVEYKPPTNNNAPNSVTTIAVTPSPAPAPVPGAIGGAAATKLDNPTEWQTKLFYDGEKHTPGEFAFGFFLPCVAQAKAKADLDGTHACYNCLCWGVGGTYSWLRSEYGITSNCGTDMMTAIFCSCCAARRAYSEVRIRGPRLSQEKEGGQWKEDIFGCSTCGFIQACFFPCCSNHEVRGFLENPDDLDCCYDVTCLMPCAMYGQVRSYYKLPAQFLPPLAEDIIMPCFLYSCALNQAVREARLRRSE